jgi:hypothetical protein
MHAAADISRRIWRAALLRRAPLWLAGALPWAVLASTAGLLAWAAFCAWDGLRLRQRVERNWARWLDHAVPELEDSSALLARADSPLARLQHQRLLARLDTAVTARDVRRLAGRRIPLGAHWVALSLVAAGILWVIRVAPVAAVAPALPAHVAALAAKPGLLVRFVPPRYTGVAPGESAPRDLQVPENSRIEWCLDNPQGEAAMIELSDGQSLKAGAGCAVWRATESVFWRWRGARYNLRVTPDSAPQITVSKPVEMVQVLAPNAVSATISVAVRDDYHIERATLHLTLARGSGENIRFTDREMPLPASSDPRVRAWTRQWALADLGMEPGDELYFFVRALDNAPRPQMVQSATYTLRLPGPAEAEDEQSSALPSLVKPENLRSQRQIIIDTEQLLADIKAAPKLDGAIVRQRSETIASDQAQLRRRYGQFLGEESTLFGGDDHGTEHAAGAKPDVMAEYGHVHDQAENATMFDDATKKVLRRALVAMWDAEKALRAISPRTALAPEHKALDAIKELQQADRIYLHKTAFAPPPIKEEIRMTGDAVGTASYKRAQGDAPEAVPAQVRELIEVLASDGALPALWRRSAHEWVRERIANDEQRLAAQRAIQDVADGCAACRPVLRAWLRGAIAQAPVAMQARPVAETRFSRAWRAGALP